MFACHAEDTEAVVARVLIEDSEATRSLGQHVDSLLSDDGFGWSEYALFILGQQGGYCQLV